jgi:hypothetical protein
MTHHTQKYCRNTQCRSAYEVCDGSWDRPILGTGPFLGQASLGTGPLKCLGWARSCHSRSRPWISHVAPQHTSPTRWLFEKETPFKILGTSPLLGHAPDYAPFFLNPVQPDPTGAEKFAQHEPNHSACKSSERPQLIRLCKHMTGQRQQVSRAGRGTEVECTAPMNCCCRSCKVRYSF